MRSGPPTGYFRPSAVEKLRILTAEYAEQCGRLKREKVEMLLLAHEILVNREVQPPTERLEEDSTRMMAVLGETTNVGSHSELCLLRRLQRIAVSSSASKFSLAEGVLGDATAEAPKKHTPARKQRIVLKPVEIPETLLFYVRLGPRLELKLTRPRLQPEPAVEQLSAKDRNARLWP